MGSIDDLIKRIIAFQDARDWKQFHNLKDCAISLSLEANEVLEHFQWKNKEEIEEYIKTNKGNYYYRSSSLALKTISNY